MREIKFRAWDKKSAKMFRVSSINRIEGARQSIRIIGKTPMASHQYAVPTDFLYKPRYELMQFTGLKDKNGVEIYEGDIVAWMTDPRSGVLDCKMAVEIRVGQLGTLQSIPAINNTSEIIGNIYENPELLKSETQETL